MILGWRLASPLPVWNGAGPPSLLLMEHPLCASHHTGLWSRFLGSGVRPAWPGWNPNSTIYWLGNLEYVSQSEPQFPHLFLRIRIVSIY